MARNFWQRSVSVSRHPRLQMESLESRVVPAIVQTGLPTWLAAGPYHAVDGQVTAIQGTFNNPTTGAVVGIAPNPLDANVAFVAGVSGGIWRTTNFQATDPTYTPLTDQLPSQSITSISLNPDNPNQVLAGLGNKSAASTQFGEVVGDLVGLYATDNALAPTPTFRVIGGQNSQFVNLSIQSVLVRNGYMLATGLDNDGGTAREGVFLSTDNGLTFRTLDGVGGLPAQVVAGGGKGYYQLTADPANPNRVYLGGQSGLFRTDNILAPTPSWTNITDPRMKVGLATVNVKFAVHNSPGNNIVYTAVANSDVLSGVFWSADLGQTWNLMDIPTSLGTIVGIQDATNATPIVITAGAGLGTGDEVLIQGVTGNLAANGIWKVTSTGAATFSLDGSVGTGVYTGGGIVQKVFGVNSGGQAGLHLSLAADPTNPSLVYIAGDRQDLLDFGTPNGVGARNFTANILRGNRSTASGNDAFAPSPQWQAITDNNALGSAPHADSRTLAFDAVGNLIDGDDGGIYRRSAPQTDNTAWVSAIGDLNVAQFNSVSQDTVNNVAFGGTQDTGVIEQSSNQPLAGDTLWRNVGPGDGGESAVDNTSSPGASIRYTLYGNLVGLERRVFNSKNVQVGPTHSVSFGSPTDPTPYKGIDSAGSSFTSKYVLNAVDPRLMLVGQDKVYEDNDPAGFAGDIVAKVTPPGMKGFTTSLAYGGRQNGINIPRIAFVGTDAGELFIRGAAGGFNPATVPGSGDIRSIVLDPDDWRTAYVLRGATGVLDYTRPFASSQVYVTRDGGLTFTDLTENIFSKTYDLNGNVVGGLSSNITSLALWDSTPNGSGPGGTVLLAGGVGGVFRYVPSIVDPTVSSGGWTQYGTALPNAFVSAVKVSGNRLTVSTMGRGVWQIPDVSTTINQAARVTVQGTDGNDNFTFGGAGTTAGSVFVSDGMGNSLFVNRKTGASFNFVGGTGADTLTIGTSGAVGGDLQFLNGRIVADLGNNPGDTIIVNDQGRAVPTNVTVTANTVGGGATDNIFAPGAVLVYSGLSQGTLRVDLGTQTVGGNLVNVQSTSAATTQLFGTNGADTFVLNGKAGTPNENGDLSGFFGTVTIDGRSGGLFGAGNVLTVSDVGATTGNANVSLVGNQVLGFAGPTDAAVISYANVTSLGVIGSDSATLAETFRVENVAAALTLANRSGPDFVNVRAANNPVTLTGGPGATTFRITSTAGDNLDGDLNGIVAPVTVNAGSGDSQLVVSNFGNTLGSQYAVTATSIAGATPQPITFSTTGRFANADGTGFWLRGSNLGDDSFTVVSTRGNGSQTTIDGDGGNDAFNVGADNLGSGGTVALRGGAGSNLVTVDSGIFGVTATSLAIVGGGGGSTRATVLGFVIGDKVTPTLTVTDTVNGNFTGVGGPILINSLSFFDYDGRGGRNNFLYRDGTNVSFGSLANPGAGIVYQPTGVASGQIRLAGVGPVVNFSNVNGTDAGGLLINGDANGTGALDTVTVVGVSDTNSPVTGALAGTTADNGADTFDVSDQAVTLFNQTLGQLRSLAVVPGTVRTLIVQGGNETIQGDTFTVTPSAKLDIFVDGQGPARKRNGNTLKVNTAEAYHLGRVANPFTGEPQTRIVTDSGASFAFKNFPNAAGVRSIFAVGADAGGGPRVRVYDAVTKEVLFDQFVYDPGFTGGVRVATGDVTGDGVPDLIVAAGTGGGPHIQVFDGITFQRVASFFAYESSFRGGSFVSVGDLNGDGVGDIVVGSGLGGGPLVKVFDGTGRALTAFFAYDKAFRGGVRVASGDVNGDGKDDIVTGAGPGGGPHVKVFNASDLRILTQYFAFDPAYTGGVFVSAGDVNGDGAADVVVGPGDNSVPQISIRDSRNGSVTPLSVFDIGVIANPDPLPLVDSNVLSAEGSQNTESGGIRVSVADLNASGTRQIVVSRGPGYVPRIRTYTVNPLAEAGNFLAFEPEFTGGIYVG